MKTFAVGIVLLTLLSLITTGCSSLATPEFADRGLSEFLSQSQHYALFTPGAITYEEKLKVFGINDYGQRLSQRFGLQNPITEVINRFVNLIPALKGTMIVHPKEARKLHITSDSLVLFFHSDWNFVYQRIPPNFFSNQLQVGIIGKIIPIAQVLGDKGPTALRTAVWEGKCIYKIFDGKFISIEDWEAHNGELLHQGIRDAQRFCADKLAAEFSKDTHKFL